MRTHSVNKLFARFSLAVFLMLMLVVSSTVVHAQAEQIFMAIAFNQKVIGIGQTTQLGISLSNAEPNPVRVTSFQCIPSSSAVSTSAISPMPTTLAVEQSFETSQTYRGVSVGTVNVHCELTAVDTVTGATYTSTSGTITLDVIQDMGLAFTAYSATQVATVGQSVFVIAKFVNRGKTAFTNVNLSCVELGRALVSVGTVNMPSIIPPGQSGFVEYRWLAVRTGGGNVACSITATESSSGKSVTLTAPLIWITVK